jgi:uncharacterized protein
MRIAVSGASGLVGSALCKFASERGHETVCLVRNPAEEGIYWSVEEEALDVEALADVDALVHLAGANIGKKRWSEKRKKEIRDSRLIGTDLIARSIAAMKNPPSIFICASAVGYYGDGGDQWLDEESPRGRGFLAELCEQWEAACDPARPVCRVVNTRFGPILSKEGGALERMLTPFKLGLGGHLGSGEQYFSWVDLDDVVRALVFIIEHDELEGPVNVTAPEPVRMKKFADVLGNVMNRPSAVPVPEFALKIRLGSQMAEELLLFSQRVRPKRLLDAGFEFQSSIVEEGLRNALR